MPFERPDDEELSRRDDAQLRYSGQWPPEQGQALNQPEGWPLLAAGRREDRAPDEHHGKDIGDEIDLWL